MNILRKEFLSHIAQTSPSPMLIEVERAEGVFFYTPQGKRYFDLVAGVSVNNVGHANDAVIDAVKRQVDSYMHVMVYGELVQRPQVEYAAKVCEVAGAGFDSLYFVNSGAEAIEVALKLSKRYTGRTGIVAMRNAYHGSTHGALSIFGGEELKNAFRPLLPDVRSIDFNDFDDLIYIDKKTACVVVEPVQGEAGVRLPERGYLEALRRRCDKVGAMLVFDEIQTGFGRSGAMFAFQKYGVVPDMVCLGKAFGGGMPLGGVLSRRQITDAFTTNPVLGHITTFGGHPVCCAAGLAALGYIVDNELSANAETIGARFEQPMAEHKAVKEVRRSGALMAIELGSSTSVMKMMELFKQAGVMSDWFLFCDTAFRISPPLTMTIEQVDECSEIILKCLDDTL